MKKVIVGMSGGVDSSVAAHLLKKEGYDVRGVSFLMWEAALEEGAPSCCSAKAAEDAGKTARALGIAHATIDVRRDFREKVVEPFAQTYLAGLTPNPCILCNRFIKFPGLIEEAARTGADYIATGHYARIEAAEGLERSALIEDLRAPHGDYFLLRKGFDPKKDQSYVLYILGQGELGRLLLPLGRYRKSEVRELAREIGVPSAARAESQEICFVKDKNYLAFIEGLFPVKSERGPIISEGGKVLGMHRGICGYTIGQRKGLGISSPEPLYVTGLDIEENAVHVGSREAAKKTEFLVGDLHWTAPQGPPPACGKDKEGREETLSFRASVKVRSMMKDEPATLYKSDLKAGGDVRVVFDEPQWAPAPGQSAVFYRGDVVIGGGIIKRPV